MRGRPLQLLRLRRHGSLPAMFVHSSASRCPHPTPQSPKQLLRLLTSLLAMIVHTPDSVHSDCPHTPIVLSHKLAVGSPGTSVCCRYWTPIVGVIASHRLLAGRNRRGLVQHRDVLQAQPELCIGPPRPRTLTSCLLTSRTRQT